MKIFNRASKTIRDRDIGSIALRDRIIIMVSLTITVPILFFLFYIYAFMNDYFYANYVDSAIEQASGHLEDSVVSNLRIIENSYSVIMNNQNIKNSLSNLATAEPSYYSDQVAKLEIETELKYIMSTDFAITKNLINAIFVLADEEHYYYVLSNYLPNETLTAEMQDFYYRYSNDSYDVIRYMKDRNSLYYMKPLTDHTTGRLLGTVLISIDTNVLAGSYGFTEDQWTSVIIDDNGFYRFHTDYRLIGTTADSSTLSHRTYAEATETPDRKHLALATYVRDLDYHTVTYIPSDFLRKDIWQFLPNYLYFILITILISALVGIYVINQITVPLRTITNRIATVSHSDFTERMPPFRYEELNDLSVEYNRMIDQIQYLFNEVYEKQLLVRESELKALHAQINPHFIFNVLESITWEARMSEEEKIEQMVTALAQLLRNNLSFTDRDMFTVEQELEYISFYLFLQKVRFSDRLAYDIQVDSDELLALTMPKFTIQTLVENAVIHGLEKKTDRGHITISLKLDAGDLVITVEDDGIGFDTENTDLGEKEGHIGLKNIRQRIHILYGEAYGVDVRSTIGTGTTAVIRIPARGRTIHE